MKELMDDSFEFLFMDSIQPPNEKNSNVMSQAVNIDVAGQSEKPSNL